MKFVPTAVHNLPHLGYRFEKWPSLYRLRSPAALNPAAGGLDGETVDRPARGSTPRPFALARAARQLEIVNDPGDEWPNAWTE
jgi:hypothetical protein